MHTATFTKFRPVTHDKREITGDKAHIDWVVLRYSKRTINNDIPGMTSYRQRGLKHRILTDKQGGFRSVGIPPTPTRLYGITFE